MNIRRVLRALALLGVLTIAGVIGLGELLIRAAHRSVGNAPADLEAITLRLPIAGNTSVSGWFAKGEPGVGAVLLLHGVRSDRRQMLERARMLRSAGYAVLLIDLPAHGESSGRTITFGLHEAKGVIAALGHLRHALPQERIGVIGVSLGAASFVLSHATPAPDAVVLESMYPTLLEAVENRLSMRLGEHGRLLAPLLLMQLPLRLGISAAQLQPFREMPNLGSPVLIASGSDDRHTTVEETLRLFRAAREPKELWIVQGAGHVDLHSHDPVAYQDRVMPYLARHLGRGAATGWQQNASVPIRNSPP